MVGKESTPKRFSAPAYYLHAVVCLLIMFGFGQLPPVEPLTPLGMNLIGIFLGVLYGWVCIEIVWPSLAGLLALMLIGGMKPMMLLNKSFGDPVVQMMFFIFVFCATISHYGLSKFISLWFITRKFVAGRPWVFTYTFLGSIFILGGLTSASPAAIIGWSILYGVCEVCGFKKGDGYPTMMVFGIVFAAQVGMSLIPFKQAALTVFSAYETMSGVGIDYAKYMLIALLICAVCSLLFIVMGKYIFRPDMGKLVHLDVSKLDKDIKRLKGMLIERMGTSCTAVYNGSAESYTITYNPVRSAGISKDALERLKDEHPDIYDQYVTVSEWRRFHVKKAALQAA